MKTLLVEGELAYDGRAINSHWAFREFGLQGDSIVAFIGPCDVKLTEMVDLADVKANAPIFSRRMVHFVVEHFDRDLEKGVLRQRLLVCRVAEELAARAGARLERRGNDLYAGDGKLNVSIAAPTPVSTKIHVGVNVVTDGTPVKTAGLAQFGVEPVGFARAVMEGYAAEHEDIQMDRCKVRPAQ